MLTLEPERLKNQPTTTRERIRRRWKGFFTGDAQAACAFSFSASKFSLLPQSQRNGCNLARQRETRHGRLDAFGQRSLVEILERSGPHTRPSGGSFEQTFQIMVVILVQAANEHLLFAAPHLAFDVVVFPAVAGFQSQSAIGPELSLGAETMRGLDQSHRQSRANWPHGGDLAQFGSDGMLATLRQQFTPGLLAQGLQHI